MVSSELQVRENVYHEIHIATYIMSAVHHIPIVSHTLTFQDSLTSKILRLLLIFMYLIMLQLTDICVLFALADQFQVAS